MSAIHNIYCDESCHMEHDHQRFMVLGGVAVPNDLKAARRITQFGKHRKNKYRYALIISQTRTPSTEEKEVFSLFDIILTCNFDSPESFVQC